MKRRAAMGTLLYWTKRAATEPVVDGWPIAWGEQADARGFVLGVIEFLGWTADAMRTALQDTPAEWRRDNLPPALFDVLADAEPKPEGSRW